MRYVVISLVAVALVASVWTGVTRAQTGDDPALDDDVVALAPGAPGPGAPGPGAPGFGAPGLRQRLGLTEAQAQKVEQILAAHRERMARLRIAMGRARLDARELTLEAKADRGKIEAVSRRIGDLYGQMVRARLEVSFELKQVLTPEQWSRYQEMMRRWRAGRYRNR